MKCVSCKKKEATIRGIYCPDCYKALKEHQRGTIPDKRGLLLAMEWGFKAHERGINLEKANEEFMEVLR